ncbi:MAG: hypothetical protein AAFQ63_22330 [Cyanobacteria bacterium J06621_11]
MTEQSANLPIPESLLSDSRQLAKELNISWSQLISVALKDFIRRHRRKKQLVDAINEAYAETPTEEELLVQQHMRLSHRKTVDGEW